MPQEGSGQVFALGECRLDLARGLLLRDGNAVPLRPKAFALLRHLAANAGRVVGKSELIDTVWPDVVVTEDSLTQAIHDVRKVLGEWGQGAIKSVARRGYMLSLPVAELPATGNMPTVAVLRFANVGGDKDKPVVDGFTEDLVNCLAAFRRVNVLARNSSFSFDPTMEPDWRTIGHRLGATYLVGGRMNFSGSTMWASVTLIETSTGAVQWSGTFTASGADIFSMQHEIALKIVNRLVSRIDDASVAGLAGRPPSSLAAYELLLRGLARFRGYRPEDNLAAKEFVEKACDRDPDYGLAHAYLALIDLAIGGYGEAPPELVSAAVERAAIAVNLSPEDARCHRILGFARLLAREFDAAEYHLRCAIELNPSDADTMNQMGYLLTMRGKPFEAIEWMDKAVRINPIHPDWYHYDRALAQYGAGDYAGAAAGLLKLPATPWRLSRLAACQAQMGNVAEAGRTLTEVERIAPGYAANIFPRNGDCFEHRSDVDHWAEGMDKARLALNRG
ncbi:winged helix-turn-helix domain-containing protein [Mesorhizobium yinganensis]|uniref:winged helix-turn-helix domain-containing protein n=1 Tax=Mesorhizobium yinganensis TaxID=3157707 RepID=UPI0032B7F084